MTTIMIAAGDDEPRRRAAKRKANGEGTVYQRGDGRWEGAGYVIATDGTRKRVRVYGRTRKEAADKLTERLANSLRGLPVAATSGTLAEYLTYWHAHVNVHQVRPVTWHNNRRVISRYLIPGLGTKRVDKLTPTDVRLFVGRLRTTCQCCDQGKDARRKPSQKLPRNEPRCCAIGNCCGQRLSAGSIAQIFRVLSTALQHAVREDLLPRNVCQHVRLGPKASRPVEPLTAAEARALITAAREHRLAALIELAIRTGLRRGEMLGLAWDDLDLDAGTATIRHTLVYIHGRGLTRSEPKTRSSRRKIALPAACVASLRDHQARQDAERDEAANKWTDNGLVFTKRKGTPVDPTGLAAVLRMLCAEAGIRRHVRFHDLRHACATLMLDSGVELNTIKELLGHSALAITADIYAHVRLRLQHDAVERLDDALNDPANHEHHAGTDTEPEPPEVR